MPGRTCVAAAAAALLVSSSPPLSAQEGWTLRHLATVPEPFGLVQSVRELPGGRVIVADPLGLVLVSLDPRTGDVRPLGREGGGPAEWRQPDAVYALPGDSTLLVDLGNARLTVIDPGGRLVRSAPLMLPPTAGAAGPPMPEPLLPRGTDRGGALYIQTRGRPTGQGGLPDSMHVKRWTWGAPHAATVARLRSPAMTTSTSGGANNQSFRVRPVPYSPQDDWAVAADGRIAVVRAEPYRVEWIQPDGRVVTGPETSWEPVRVREAEKRRWLDQLGASGLTMSVTSDNGSTTMALQRGGRRAAAASAEDYEWPERLPAFRAGGAVVMPDGRLLVEREVAEGDPTRYDVFDARGTRAGALYLPTGQRIVGFGRESVYAVRVDQDGLNWLEVYALPG